MSESITPSVCHEELPIFIYGSLRMGGMERVIGATSLIRVVPAFIYGVKKGIGDMFLCADITLDLNDKTEGKLCYIDKDAYADSIRILDEYEGVVEGYYERHVVFAHNTTDCSVSIPSWLYTRGDLL